MLVVDKVICVAVDFFNACSGETNQSWDASRHDGYRRCALDIVTHFLSRCRAVTADQATASCTSARAVTV